MKQLLRAKMVNLVCFIQESRKRKLQSKRPIICDLVFRGYFAGIESLPSKEGIYVAFASKASDSSSDFKLLYIGIGTGSDCIRKRVGDHIRNDHNSAKWLKHYNHDTEEIVYSYALMDDVSRIMEIENALIFKANPLVNEKSTRKVHSEAVSITVNCKGDIGSLKSHYYWDHISG